MHKRRMYLLVFIATMAVVAIGSIIIHGESTNDEALARPTEVMVETSTTSPPTPPVETTTTIDPAHVERFLEAWRLSETTATTTAPPPPPPPPAPTTTRPAQPARPSPTTPPAAAPSQAGGSGCVIPSYICKRESGFSYSALNKSSGAGGMYQFMPSTWNGIAKKINPAYVGVPPHTAPPHVQDQFASYLWAGGAGCSHWSAC